MKKSHLAMVFACFAIVGCSKGLEGTYKGPETLPMTGGSSQATITVDSVSGKSVNGKWHIDGAQSGIGGQSAYDGSWTGTLNDEETQISNVMVTLNPAGSSAQTNGTNQYPGGYPNNGGYPNSGGSYPSMGSYGQAFSLNGNLTVDGTSINGSLNQGYGGMSGGSVYGSSSSGSASTVSATRVD
jgi:hypothetical protein